ncbi:MAG: acyltransferase [Sphingobacteriales bacterium]|nr:MAG: acyltransferase [Sphingobacteriales bacterium]
MTGWKTDGHRPPQLKKCIVLAAPHTSNWDFWYAMATFAIYKLPIRFTVKKEWVKFPFSLLMNPLGAIAIDRRPRGPQNERPSFVEAMADLFNRNESLIILITPEGTRSRNDQWKTGFYHVAKSANAPILLGYIDYAKKITGITDPIYLTDYETDMKKIMAFYKTITPKFPEKFALDADFDTEGH